MSEGDQPRSEYVHGSLADPPYARYLWAPVLGMLPEPPARVCDVGCGNGALAARLKRLGYDVAGVDPSATGLELARQRGVEVDFRQLGVYDDVPGEWLGRFDAVVSLEVIEHLLLPRELAAFAGALLRPGGTLVVSTLYNGHVKYLALALTGRMTRHLTPLWDHGHIKFFNTKTLARLLQAAGFTGIEFAFAGGLPLLWKWMVVRAVKESSQRST